MDYLMEHEYNEEKRQWDISLAGEIDIFNSSDFKMNLINLINEKNSNVYIDCKNLEYVDSTGLGALIAVLKNVKVYNGDLILGNVKPNVIRLFKITNLDKVFIIEGEKI